MHRSISASFVARIRTRLAVVAIGACAALVAAPAADAQFGGRSGMASMFTPDFMPRDLPVFVDALSLEEWQRPVLEQLLDDYQTNFDTAADGVRAKMSEFKDVAAGASPERVVEMISAPLVAWTGEKKKLRDDFLQSVRSLLGESQADLWPRLERALRREKSLPLGELSGESLDLTLVLRESQVPLQAETEAVLEQYEMQLDEALAARDAALDSSIAPLLKAMSSSDSSSGIATQESIMQKRVVVRDVQEQSIAAIRDSLGAEYGAKFERRALQRAFPQVFRPDPLTPLFEGVLALTDLPEDQRAAVVALQSQFDGEHAAVRTSLVDAYRVSEPREPRRKTELARQKAAGAAVRIGDAPEVEGAKNSREELFEKYRGLITAALTEEQRNAVPGLAKGAVDGAAAMPASRGVDGAERGPTQPQQPQQGEEPLPPGKTDGAKPSATEEQIEGERGFNATSGGTSNAPKKPKGR